MKIKIIRRAATEKIVVKNPSAENNHPAITDVRRTRATIKFWVDDLRQKRKRERLSFEELFSPEPCT